MKLRGLRPEDAKPLGTLFDSLSRATRSRYNPHERSSAEAERICAGLESDPRIFFVAVGEGGEITAYVVTECRFPVDETDRYHGYGIELDDTVDCRIAPVVADRYQGQGIGTKIMTVAVDSLRAQKKRRIVLFGGTQASNVQAQKMYVRVGFTTVGEFSHKGIDNYDMMLDLTAG